LKNGKSEGTAVIPAKLLKALGSSGKNEFSVYARKYMENAIEIFLIS